MNKNETQAGTAADKSITADSSKNVQNLFVSPRNRKPIVICRLFSKKTLKK